MEKNFWDSVPSRLKQQWGDHGYPECDCDMCGGDETCKILPPFETGEEYIKRLVSYIMYLEKYNSLDI
jgi:hypothetical protein